MAKGLDTIFNGQWVLYASAAVLCMSFIITRHIGMLLLICLFFYRLWRYKNTKLLLYSGLVAVSVSYWTLYYQSQNHTQLAAIQTAFNQVYVSAQDIKVDGDALVATGYYRQERLLLRYTLQTAAEKAFFQHNDKDMLLSVTGSLQSFDTRRNPHQFDYQAYMREQQRIFWAVKVRAYTVLKQTDNWRVAWQRQLQQRMPEHVFTYVRALVFGESDDSILQEHYQRIGLVFIFICSGLHIQSVLNWLRYSCLRLGLSMRLTKWAVRLAACFLFYTSGQTIGTKKAILLQLLPKRIPKLDALGLLVLLFCLHNPYVIFHSGFQFSFLMSLCHKLAPQKSVFLWLMSLPLFSYYQFEISLAPLLFGFICLHVMKRIILPAIWLSICLVMYTPFYQWGVGLIDNMLIYWNSIIDYLASLQWLSWVTGRLSIWHYIALYACFIAWYLARARCQKRQWLYVGVLLYLFLPMPAQRIIVLDVGQGDSILIQDGHEAALIDTGGDVSFVGKETWRYKQKKSLAKRLLIPTLKSLGIQRLRYVFVTHADLDHMGALKELAQTMPVQDIVYGKGADVAGTQAIVAPQTYQIGQVSLYCLYPWRVGKGTNEDSLVFYTVLGGKRWLFTGDLGKDGEQALLKRYPDLKVDVLKVGHHGSNTSTSTAFLKQLAPQVALISVGKQNRYGHPHQDVVARLQQMIVYRTDVHGAILFEKNQNKWYFHTIK